MEEIIKDISRKTLEELEKANRLPYPFYYKEVFNEIAKDMKVEEQLNPKLLCKEPSLNESLLELTANTINEFQKKSYLLKNSSEEIIEEIHEVDPDELKSNIVKFSAFLIQNLEDLEKKVKELETELDKAYKELLIDTLTKAYNRKALEKDLNNLLKKGKEKNLDLCIAILDLDNFKGINDTFGHLVGDFVLIKFVQIVKSLIRKTDKIYRYGGDEFVVIFNRSNPAEATNIIERIINKIDKTKLKYKDYLIKLTVSVGVTCHKKGDDMESIIKRADEALYEAKVTKNEYKVK